MVITVKIENSELIIDNINDPSTQKDLIVSTIEVFISSQINDNAIITESDMLT